MRNVVRSAAAALLLGAPALAQASPVIGSWTLAAETPQGRLETTVTFLESGGTYSVDLESPVIPDVPRPAETITDIVIDGNSFSFKRTVTMPQGPIEITYAGTVDGDALSGEASTATGGMAITGTRN